MPDFTPHSRKLLFIIIFTNFIIQSESEYFSCSDEYALDWELYGHCITETCGRFFKHLEEKELKILDEVAKIIEKQVVLKHSNQTVVVADLVSESITIGQKLDVLKTDFEFRSLTQGLLENIGYKIREMVQELFEINSKLWISSPILLSWIRSNDNDHSPHIYTKFHTDQLTHADSTAFHYTAVVYLDNENSQFQGGHLEFQNGPIIQPERGLAVIFTSGQENRHRVTPVHSGIRRALTFFFTCDKSYSVTNSYFAK